LFRSWHWSKKRWCNRTGSIPEIFSCWWWWGYWY